MPQAVPLAPIPLQLEFLWASTRVTLHAARINIFVQLKNALEDAWLNGEQVVAERLLDEMEQQCGVSFFLLEAKLALLQHYRGLEPQKSYVAEVLNRARSGIVQFTAHYLSQKNENATNQIFFKRRVDSAIARTNAHPPLKEYLRFRQFRDLPASHDAISGVIRHEENSSLVDQYETLLLALAQTTTSQEGRQALELLYKNVQDPRLDHLRLLYGSECLSHSATPSTSVRAQFQLDTMNATEAITLTQNCQMKAGDVCCTIVEALARCDAKEAPKFESPTPRQTILSLLFSVATKAEGYEENLYELLRVVECYAPFRFADTMRPILFELASDKCFFDDSLRRRYFLSTGEINPLALPVIPASSKEAFIAALQKIGYALGKPDEGEAMDRVALCDLRWRMMLAEDPCALSDGAMANSAPFTRLSRQVIRRRIHHQLDECKLQEAIFSIAKSYLEDPQMLIMLPITRAVGMLDEDEIADTTGNPLFLAIVYDLYLRYFGDDRPFIRNDAYEDFLSIHGVERPSELKLERFTADERAYVVYFLTYVCVPEVMSSSPYFESSKSLEAERIEVCTLLRKIDAKNAAAHEAELREITRKQIISEGLRDVERSKFAIDLNPIRRWADKNLKESFARFQALRLAGVKASTIHSPINSENGVMLPEAANDETTTLLTDMIDSFLYESYTNSFYGLDSYISLRARHGALSGQLRAPLEEGHIITQRAEGNDEYQSNQYWLSRLPLEPRVAIQLDQSLRSFSAQFDKIAKDFAGRRLQIEAPDKPEALFTYKILNLDVLQVSAELRSDSAFSMFVHGCIDVFWANLEQSLSAVREVIDSELRRDLMSVTAKLISEIEMLRQYSDSVDELISAVRHSQTRLNQSLTNLQEWFYPPRLASTKLFTMDEIADIGLQQIRRLHPNFDPEIHRTISVSIRILELRRFSDMFFIIFENIQKHCGLSRQPVIDLTIIEKRDHVLIEVLSDFHQVEDPEPRLAKIREIIASGTYQHVVRSEGGTGLVKLWNIIRNENPSAGVDSTLEFGVVNDRFSVKVDLPFTIIT